MRTVVSTYIDQGIAISAEKTAINMIQQNLDNKLISSVTGLSTEDILKLQSKT